jgi:hypothetical protein
MKKVFLLMLSLSLVLLLTACDSDENGDKESNTPVLSSLSPSSSVSHMPAFTLTASGSKFTANSRIVFNGNEMETTYISGNELRCQIGPDDTNLLSESHNLSSLQDTNVSVLVRNPSNEGGDSNQQSFSVLSNHIFTSSVNISNTSAYSRYPRIALDEEGNINLIWEDASQGNWEIFFSRSTDKGNSWAPIINLSNNLSLSGLNDIAVDNSGNLNVVWEDDSSGNFDIYYSCSTDDGTSWSQMKNISYTWRNSYWPNMAIDRSGNINVVWQDQSTGYREVFFGRSTDKGQTWNPCKNISMTIAQSRPWSIATDNSGYIYVVWYDETAGKSDIYFRSSADGGISWSLAKNLSNNSGDSEKPIIAIDNKGNLNVVWWDETPGISEIYFCRSIDKGVSWSDVINVSNTAGSSSNPNLAIDSAENLNVVWEDNTYGYRDIFYSRSIDNGTSWSTRQKISDFSGVLKFPRIAVDSSGNLFIIWYNDTAGSYNIYFSRSEITN